MALIQRYDGIPYALGKARTCIDEAKGVLIPFPDSEAKTALLTIADYIIERRL
jgi:octaprenyl-diphosphate synthase